MEERKKCSSVSPTAPSAFVTTETDTVDDDETLRFGLRQRCEALGDGRKELVAGGSDPIRYLLAGDAGGNAQVEQCNEIRPCAPQAWSIHGPHFFDTEAAARSRRSFLNPVL